LSNFSFKEVLTKINFAFSTRLSTIELDRFLYFSVHFEAKTVASKASPHSLRFRFTKLISIDFGLEFKQTIPSFVDYNGEMTCFVNNFGDNCRAGLMCH
jgi:hypothetical protein